MLRPSYLITTIFIGLILSCTNKKVKHEISSQQNIQIDTNNARNLYYTLKGHEISFIDSIYFYLIVYLYTENKESLFYEHIQYYNQLSDSKEKPDAITYLSKGIFYNRVAQYDSAQTQYNQALKIYEKLNYQPGLAALYFAIGINLQYKGDYSKSIMYHLKSLNIYEKLNDSNNIYQVKGGMAIIYYYEKKIPEAINITQEVLKYNTRKDDKSMMAFSESILAVCYHEQKDYTAAINYAKLSLDRRKVIHDTEGMAESLNNLSISYAATLRWQEAISTLQESIELTILTKNLRQLPVLKMNLAKSLLKCNRNKEAEELFLKLIDESSKTGQIEITSGAYKQLSYMNEHQKKDFKQALIYYKKYSKLKDSISNAQKSKQFDELVIKYDTKEKENQINKFSIQQRLDNTRKVTYLLMFVASLIIAILTTLFLINKNKQNKLVIEKVSLELKASEQELTFLTQSIIRKNKSIEDLELSLSKNQISEQSQNQFDDNNEQLSALYQFKILTEDDWRQFKVLFDKLHPGILNKLRSKFPELSPAEERQFLLMRLNIDSKECADMLGISLSSVKKNKYRLKKRFFLDPTESLNDFVREFS